MTDYMRVWKWPVVAFVIAGVVHLLSLMSGVPMEMILPTLTPITLALGLWVGYKTVQMGGSFWEALGSGVALGIVGAILALVLSTILGTGLSAGTPLAIFMLGHVIIGAVIGGGFAQTK